MARACSSSQVTATASEYGDITTLPSHPAISARLRGPQLRSTVHLVSSPSVTNEMHHVRPVRRARSGSARCPRKEVDARSVVQDDEAHARPDRRDV